MNEYEQLLQALLNGDTSNIVARSRTEEALKNCIEGCGRDGLVEPKSRVEAYLHAFAEKLKGGNAVGSVAIDQTLTKEGYAADAKAVGDAIAKLGGGNESAEIYIILENGAEPMTIKQFCEMADFEEYTINVQVVKTLPDNMNPSQFGGITILNLYIEESTGIVWLDDGEIITLGTTLEIGEGVDKGWTTDVNAETETGVYCVRTGGGASGGLSIKKIEFTDRPSAWEWLKNNYAKVIKATLTTNMVNHLATYSVCFGDYDNSGNVVQVTFSNTVPSALKSGYVKLWLDILRITHSTTLANMQGHSVEMGEGVQAKGAEMDTVPDEYWSAMAVAITCYYID